MTLGCILAKILPEFLYTFCNSSTSFSSVFGAKTNLDLVSIKEDSFSSVNFLLPSKEISLTVGYSVTEITSF